MARHTISLPDPLDAFVENRILEDGFGSESEYFADLVRRDQARRAAAEQELRALIDAAEASGISPRTVDEIREAARARARARGLI